MSREEFLNRLEYLLQDISEEEKRDALDYYRDYLDEAGPEKEQEVLAEFDSPERIASIIRTDLMGGMDQAGEFTDSGYEDERFKRRAYPAVQPERARPETDGPGTVQPETEHSGEARSETAHSRTDRSETAHSGTERSESARSETWSFDGKKGDNRHGYRDGSYADNREERKGKLGGGCLKCLLIAVLLLIIAPIGIAAGAGVFGLLVGVGCVLLAFILVLAILTFCGFLIGAILLVVGIGSLFADVWLGVFCIGSGLVGLGAGCLLFICAYLFYGRFLPWMVMGIINSVSSFLNRNRNRKMDNGDQNGGR